MAKQVVEFEVGDVVILKSGGPAMTVNHFHSDGSVSTTWFSDEPTPQVSGSIFSKDMLKLHQSY